MQTIPNNSQINKQLTSNASIYDSMQVHIWHPMIIPNLECFLALGSDIRLKQTLLLPGKTDFLKLRKCIILQRVIQGKIKPRLATKLPLSLRSTLKQSMMI